MFLVVGLGNPGADYVGTRHNIGWDVLDELAARCGLIANGQEFNRLARKKFDGLTLDGSIPVPGGTSEKLLLLKPTTYMNDSGRSVQAALSFFQITPIQMMVVLDDLALPAGKLRIRKSGSSGGHNGLKDIERVLATDQYPRLRLGIDAPPQNIPGRDYVLGRFSDEQKKRVAPAVGRAADAIRTWIEKGIDASMNAFNANEES
jgi:peptidyl-tRNA hydrolase, PTH1 family